ncbi:MAG TPA: MBL fold metallo-hydrolase [Syntrophomonadaceae bacterium]|nr:MBL fold metallo-hydrolase [Syntrophomonadaceae bacterium]
MQVKSLAVGSMMANCYIIWCRQTKDALVIDPGGDGSRILAEIKKEGLKVKYIVNTHGHIDHIAANYDVKEGTGAKLLIHPDDAPLLTNPDLNLSLYMGSPFQSPKADMLISDGEEIAIGNLRFEVLHTPGHTRGGVCLKTEGAIFTGDTLFAGSIGRTDFPGGSYKQLLDSIRNKILPSDDNCVVYPGHGPASTVGHERVNNPFL